MTCLSDDALLDWALLGREADPAVDAHLTGCPACRERSRAVLAEQSLLRDAFAEPASPVGLTTRVLPAREPRTWARVGIAALLLLGLGGVALLLQTAHHPARVAGR
ncbi:MAG: hypothetical protein JO332_06975, partial [Planctomycetaceae bacterium]|nr:hypothetical protein [Planctomycetaceae bacterium]